jgi:uncharacterized membrane protein
MLGLGWQELLLVLLVGGVVYLLFFSAPVRRRLTGIQEISSTKVDPAPHTESAEEILAVRFARGEINQTEYEAMRAAIQPGRNGA